MSASIEKVQYAKRPVIDGRAAIQMIEGWGVRVDGALMTGNDDSVSVWKKRTAMEIADSLNGGSILRDRVARSISTGC